MLPAQWAEGSLLPLQAAGGAERLAVERRLRAGLLGRQLLVVGRVSLATRRAAEALEARLKKIFQLMAVKKVSLLFPYPKVVLVHQSEFV